MRKLVALAALVAVALAAVGAASSSTTSTPTLKGVVGPGFSIKLTKGGKPVKKLKAGKYKIVVTDRASIHSFVVEREKPSKPKLEKTITGVGFTGKKTVVMTLKPGSWRFYCAPHESVMHGDFKVTR